MSMIAMIFNVLLSVLTNFALSDIQGSFIAVILFLILYKADGMEIKIITK